VTRAAVVAALAALVACGRATPPPPAATAAASAPPVTAATAPPSTPATAAEADARPARVGDHDTHATGHVHARRGEPLGHTFEDAERWAKQFDDPGRDRWQRPAEVIAALAVAPAMVVADIGAGTGYFAIHLAAAVGAEGRVLALDIEPDMVRYLGLRAAREGLAQLAPRQVAVDDPGLAPGSVDRVLIVNTWHHIPAREAYAVKLAAALAPGGAIMVVDYRLDAERGPPRHHRLSAATVATELASAGLVTEILPHSLPYQYMVVARPRR
jgi:predicted methyltransferase